MKKIFFFFTFAICTVLLLALLLAKVAPNTFKALIQPKIFTESRAVQEASNYNNKLETASLVSKSEIMANKINYSGKLDVTEQEMSSYINQDVVQYAPVPIKDVIIRFKDDEIYVSGYVTSLQIPAVAVLKVSVDKTLPAPHNIKVTVVEADISRLGAVWKSQEELTRFANNSLNVILNYLPGTNITSVQVSNGVAHFEGSIPSIDDVLSAIKSATGKGKEPAVTN